MIAAANTHQLFQGDIVVSLSTGYIDMATPGSTQIAGVFVGCEYFSTAFNRRVQSNYWPGSGNTGDVDAFIIDDPNCVFLAQSWTASTNKMTLANIGNNIQFNTYTNNNAVPNGNTLNGLSGNVLNADVTGSTSTYAFRVIDVPGISASVSPLTQTVGAAANGYDITTIYNVALVAFNNQDFKVLSGI